MALRVLLPNYPHSEELEQYIEQITRTSIGYLWLLVFRFSIFSFPILMRLYNNAAKIFGAKGALCRRLENLESEMGHTTRGSICITGVSA